MSTRPPLLFNVTVAAPPEEAFKVFFHQPDRWLCRTGFVEPLPAGRLRFCWPDGCVEGQWVQYQPPSTGRFSWHFDGDELPDTMVVVSFAPAERDGQPCTRVEVEHYGFGAGDDWDALYVSCAVAWAGYLKNLRAIVDADMDLREDAE
jgi:uncharacterized protein YndB with AHSA1/START domain